MRDLSLDELKQRFSDVVHNVLELSPDGKLQIGSHTAAFRDLWGAKLTHVFDEFGRRGGIPGDIDMPTALPKLPVRGVRPLGAIASEGCNLQTGRHLIKFGKARYLKDMVTSGNVLVSPAARYDDPSLNYAVRDNELSIFWYVLKNDPIDLYDQRTGELIGEFKAPEDITVHVSSERNYYVYCVSESYSLRCFDDFEADSVVVIHDPAEFSRRIRIAMQENMSARWVFRESAVKYFDPLEFDLEMPDVFFAKTL